MIPSSEANSERMDLVEGRSASGSHVDLIKLDGKSHVIGTGASIASVKTSLSFKLKV